jgi:hypothetical protein
MSISNKALIASSKMRGEILLKKPRLSLKRKHPANIAQGVIF